MSRPSFSQLAQKFVQQRARGFPGGSSGGSGGQGGPGLGQALGGVGGIVLLAAAGLTVNNALFNGKLVLGLIQLHEAEVLPLPGARRL